MGDTTGATAAAGGTGISEEEERARLAAIIDNVQSRDAIRMYSWLSQRCFADCVHTFYRKNLGKTEGDCVRACVRKYRLVASASDAGFRALADPTATTLDDEDED